METRNRDGYKFQSVLNDPMGCFIVESDRVDRCVEYINKNDLSHISVRSTEGFHGGNIDFIDSIQHSIRIEIVGLKEQRLPAINSSEIIRELILSSDINEFSLGSLPLLEKAYLNWNKSIFEHGLPRHLSVLHLHGLRSPLHDLKQFPSSKSLLELALIDSRSISSICGVERFPKLQRLEMSYLSKLENIESLAILGREKQLISVFFNKCRNIARWSALGTLGTVRELHIHGCLLRNLDFVPSMDSLEHFRFINTEVANGDLSPLVQSDSLRKIAFTNKKNFSHTESEILRVLKARS